MSLEKRLHGDFEYVGIYVQNTFVGIAYIILIAHYHINEFKMYVNALAGLCLNPTFYFIPAYMKYNIEVENVCVYHGVQ